MKRIYLDHAAATPVDPRVLKAMAPFWSVEYGNPSAIHKEGVVARKAVEESRRNIGEMLGVHPDEIVFTGSATESCNLALFGAVSLWKKRHPKRTPHIIVSAVEHDAVLFKARELEMGGVRLTILPVNMDGVVSPSALKGAITEDTVLVSVMYANNEIGVVQPIREIAKVIRKWKKEHRGLSRDAKQEGESRYPLFHTDATQAVNYCDVHAPRLGVDMLTCNAAKIYGPKGIGLLAVSRDVSLYPVIVGGGQERGLRAGTENVPLIIGFAQALSITRKIQEKEGARLVEIRDNTIANLTREIPAIIINGTMKERLPNNIHFSLPETDHEYLAIALDARGVAVATKSACNERDAETSHVLLALDGGAGTRPYHGLRITMGRGTAKKDMHMFAKTLKEVLKTMIAYG